jgi:hypothetical protein
MGAVLPPRHSPGGGQFMELVHWHPNCTVFLPTDALGECVCTETPGPPWGLISQPQLGVWAGQAQWQACRAVSTELLSQCFAPLPY